MIKLIARRVMLGLITLIAISILVFAGTEILPGDVAGAVLGQSVTAETKAAWRERLGLDRPVSVRYFEWLGNILTGDLGNSFATDYPVAEIVKIRLWNTLFLAVVTTLVAVPISVALGLLSAAFPDGWFDRTTSIVSLFLISVPEYLIAILLVMAFAVHWNLFPALTYTTEFQSLGEAARALTLPVTTLVVAMLAHIVRMTRAAVLDVLRSSYIEMAILKGAGKSRIILRHALPNALAAIVNVVALNIGYLISGVVIIEVVFSYPGLGRLMVDSVAVRDMPLIQITAMFFCAAYISLNIIADVIAIVSNPRLRYGK